MRPTSGMHSVGDLSLRGPKRSGCSTFKYRFALRLAPHGTIGCEKKRRRLKDRVVVDVITRLHGRAASVAGEVQALLCNGFADGALSRWRTMHELTVTAMFIAQLGPDVAERFAAHVHADSIKSARQYQTFASILGFRQISIREQRDLEATACELERRYGKCFLGDYGWAAEALGSPRPTCKHRSFG